MYIKVSVNALLFSGLKWYGLGVISLNIKKYVFHPWTAFVNALKYHVNRVY